MNFRFWEQKQNPMSQAILLGLNDAIVGPDIGAIRHENFETLSKETYQRNATVYTCVSLIASLCGTVPWILMQPGASPKSPAKRMMTKARFAAAKARVAADRKGAYPFLAKALETTEIVEHPLLSLIEQPNPSQAQAEFLEQLFSYWLISGNAFLRFLTTTTSGKTPREMWNYRPDRTEVVPAKINEVEQLGLVGGYVYKVDKNDKRKWETIDDPASMVHFKFFHPTNDWYGMSPLSAAARDWQTDNKAGDWNHSLITRGARPGGALVAATAVADDVYERLKQELEDSYSGAGNTGKPMFLQGGLKWEQMGLSPLELDFLRSMDANENRICRVYRVPPEIFGFGRAGIYQEARSALWQDGCLPLLDKFRDMLNLRLTPLYGSGLYLDYDRDQIEAIQEDETARWQRLNQVGFLSTNEKRQAAGYETSPHPLADTPVFLLNPTPGATGLQPGTPAPPKSMQDVLDALGPAEKKILENAFLKAKGNADKMQKLEDRLRALAAKAFKNQGRDLAAFIRRELK